MKKLIFTLLALLAMASQVQAQQWTNTDPYYARRTTLFELLPIGPEDIVFMGNSLTDGCEFNELLGNPNIKNRGIVGDIVQGLIERADPVIKGQPKKIFIMSGVNDISHGVSGDSIARAMERLVVMIKEGSPRTQIYIQSLLPFNNKVREWKLLKDREHVVIEGNVCLEQMAHRHGVTFINLYPLFVDDEGLLKQEFTNDGLHLMGAAYAVWRDAVQPYVNQ